MSSGDLIADRRFERARAALAEGDAGEAADLAVQALELVPDYGAAWYFLGELRQRQGDRAGAVAAFTAASTSEGGDRHGAAIWLVRLGAQPQAAMPREFVRTLYDNYAPRFEPALAALSYNGPELLLRAVEKSGARLNFDSAFDLGCGTGLAGAAFRPFCAGLAGVDLSSAMLAQARGKGIYDRLHEADIMTALAEEAAIGAHHQLVLAADVFIYLADLRPVCAAVARVLSPGGLFAFTLETHDGDGVLLHESHRYAHDAAHVRDALDKAALSILRMEAATIRTEKNKPVPGYAVVAAPTGPTN